MVFENTGRTEKNFALVLICFGDWLANINPPLPAYCAFTPGRPIALEKQTCIFPVGIGKNWIYIFCEVCAEGHRNLSHKKVLGWPDLWWFKYRNWQVHTKRSRYLDSNSSMENWGFILFNAKNAFNKINHIEMMWTVHHLWPYRARFF